MTFVYVLSSSPNDTYYEQFFISAVSLRFFNPGARIVVLSDPKTKTGLAGKRTGYGAVVSEIITVDTPPEFSLKEASRWIKTSINRYVTGDFLFIDCDTVITGALEDNFGEDVKIGAVLDTHVPLSQHHLRVNFEAEDKKLAFVSSLETGLRYNGGVIFSRDGPESRAFFEKWHSLWLQSREKGNSQDMPPLNQANFEAGGIISALGGEWNCQISHNGLPFLHNAKIIHYYATALVTLAPAFSLASPAILSSIKETGIIRDDIMEKIKNPKAAFEYRSRIIAGQDALDVVNSNFFAKLLWLRKKNAKLFGVMNRMLMLIKNTKNKRV